MVGVDPSEVKEHDDVDPGEVKGPRSEMNGNLGALLWAIIIVIKIMLTN